MVKALEKSEQLHIDRRQFIGAAAAATATLALVGCNTVTEVDPAKTFSGEALPPGEWVAQPCTVTCSSGCANFYYVSDGVPIRQRSDQSHADSPDHPQQRGCPKGRAHRQFILGSDRLKYPMKRKSWQPGGGDDNVNAELRGQDEWERLSWDDALDITASELKRIKDTYGNLAFLATNYMTRYVPGTFYNSALLNAFGGSVTVWGQMSRGSLPVVTYTITNGYNAGSCDRISLQKTKLLVLFGQNTVYNAGGTHTWYYRHAKNAGAKVILVDAWFNPTAQGVVDEWIPCRPGTDGALCCGVAYHMIENDLQDQEYLDKYCVGFDGDHMPEGEEGENFKDYILGTYDGIPKTPEWAAEICGASPDAIRSLAQQMGESDPVAIRAGAAITRTENGHRTSQLLYTLAWMTGSVGKEGGGVNATSTGTANVNAGSAIVALGSSGIFTAPDNPVCTKPWGNGLIERGEYDPNDGLYYGIILTEIWDAILNGKHHHLKDGLVDCNIKCLYRFNISAPFNQYGDTSKAVKALRAPGKIEFHVVGDPFPSPDALFADIVLPVVTPWEYAGGFASGINREAIVVGKKMIEPLFEAKTDWWIERELAQRLDIDPDTVASPYQDYDWALKVVKATVADNKGEKQNLVSVTASDITDLGLPSIVEPQDGIMPIQDLYAQGVYSVPRSSGDGFDSTPLKAFYDDPVANPLTTRTGKHEIASSRLVERYANLNMSTIDYIPKYEKAFEGYEDSFSNWATKTRGEHAFQMISYHHIRAGHSMFGNVKSANELFSNNAIINDRDAADLGLNTNDTALISNQYGKVLRRVTVSSRVMPGVVMMGEGNWINLDEEGIDRGGNTNTLTPVVICGEGTVPYNTLLVKIERWTGTPLEPDYLIPQVTVTV